MANICGCGPQKVEGSEISWIAAERLQGRCMNSMIQFLQTTRRANCVLYVETHYHTALNSTGCPNVPRFTQPVIIEDFGT